MGAHRCTSSKYAVAEWCPQLAHFCCNAQSYKGGAPTEQRAGYEWPGQKLHNEAKTEIEAPGAVGGADAGCGPGPAVSQADVSRARGVPQQAARPVFAKALQQPCHRRTPVLRAVPGAAQ